jgi:hypothetical protein
MTRVPTRAGQDRPTHKPGLQAVPAVPLAPRSASRASAPLDSASSAPSLRAFAFSPRRPLRLCASAVKLVLPALLLAALPLAAQFQLFQVDTLSERPVADTLDLGSTGRGDPLSARFRLRNTSSAPAPVRLLEVAGSGFSIAERIALPQTVNPAGAIDFTVVFNGGSDGTYSAVLRTEGVAVLLTANVTAQLTLALDGVALANGGTVNFGVVERGTPKDLRLLIRNQTGRDQLVPALVLLGEAFRFPGELPAGRLLAPLDEVVFDIRFTPAVVGAQRGTLGFGSRSFTLTGTGVEPPLPRPRLSVTLARAASGQQGSVAVLLAERSRTRGSGTVTLEFRPQLAGAGDSAIVFSNGTRTAPFTIAEGDDRGYFGEPSSVGFQTGTTAGAITITVQLGDATDRQTIEIAPAAPVIPTFTAARTSTGLDLRLTGFDNMRTAGPLAFTFYDRAGAVMPPGEIRADASGDFGRYFQGAENGLFLLRVTFPVTGNPADVDAVEVTVTNSAGTTRSPRTKF